MEVLESAVAEYLCLVTGSHEEQICYTMRMEESYTLFRGAELMCVVWVTTDPDLK